MMKYINLILTILVAFVLIISLNFDMYYFKGEIVPYMSCKVLQLALILIFINTITDTIKGFLKK